MGEIVNKIKESGLIQMDLADFKPQDDIVLFDIKDQLWKGIALKEKDFRNFIKTNDWSQYHDKVVGVYCSVDAIIPTWAYMLVVSRLEQEGVKVYIGDKKEVEKQLTLENIKSLSTNEYADERIIIKGCSDISHPAFAMSELVKHLQPVAKSIMYGEPCSTVPIYKKR